MQTVHSTFARLSIFVFALMTAGALLVGGCGSNAATPDAGPNFECVASGFDCTSNEECCTGNCDAEMGICTRAADVCSAAGSDCQLGTDCCSLSCVGGECSSEQCTSDNEACTQDGECCGGTCEGDVCKPLNATCKTSGNSCADSADCCSKSCVDSICSASPSYCAQTNDVCTSDFECCGGLCTIAEGSSLGTCSLVPAEGAGGCLSAGQVCGGVYDGGELPTCGGECCSRACQPYGPSGVLICQPPSGCRPTGEICANDSDCCGGEGNPDFEKSGVSCSKVDGNALGRCNAGNSCTPAGGICRLKTTSCNENANCCSGVTLQEDTCALDSVGIPRCLVAAIDCTDPSIYEGDDCATSADCCGLPCTPAGTGEFPPLTCGGDLCVDSGGTCTTNADCCSGLPCNIETGNNSGTCGGTPGDCAEYGQTCTAAADCCNNVPCSDDGFCRSDIIID